MAVITGIVSSPRREGRFVVQVDGRPAATVGLEALDRLRLAVGRPYDEALRAETEREEAVLTALDRALNMLASRARSRSELRRQLLRKGEPAEAADAALERLAAAALLDDEAYARGVARSKVLGAGHSKRRLGQELYRRGVAPEVAERAIGAVLAEENADQAAILERLARKKLRSLARLDPASRDRRLYGFLARRGYDSDEIRRVMREVARSEVEADGGEIDGELDGTGGG